MLFLMCIIRRYRNNGQADRLSVSDHAICPSTTYHLKWCCIIGWLTAPFTDKIYSSVTVSGTKLPMLYSKHSFTGKILRNTRVFYFIGKTADGGLLAEVERNIKTAVENNYIFLTG